MLSYQKVIHWALHLELTEKKTHQNMSDKKYLMMAFNFVDTDVGYSTMDTTQWNILLYEISRWWWCEKCNSLPLVGEHSYMFDLPAITNSITLCQ